MFDLTVSINMIHLGYVTEHKQIPVQKKVELDEIFFRCPLIKDMKQKHDPLSHHGSMFLGI